jgi:putative transposase
MKKAFKYRLYPTAEQQKCLAKQFGSARFVYNNALAFKKEAYDKEGKHSSKYDLIKRLVSLKQEFSWLTECDSQVLQQSIGNLDRAFSNFFAHRAGFPQFKNKYARQSIQYPQRVKVDQENNTIYLPKVGWIKIILHRPFDGKIKTVNVSQTVTGKYYASILCDTEIQEPPLVQNIEKIVGLDLGLHDLVVSSEGLTTGNPKFIKRASANLTRKQKKLSRKTKGSKRRKKAGLLVAKAHEKVVGSRSNFQHVWSKQLVDENQAIIVEDLNIKGMVKNRKLSKAISDASWHSLLTKLEYKSAWQGKHLVKIDRFYASTKTCNSCGQKQEMELSQRVYSCSCGWYQTRDINAALNIRKQGIEKLKAAGYSVSVRRGCVRLPKEATACEARSPFL